MMHLIWSDLHWFGVREGNVGMDCRINFLLLLRPGEDVPNSLWWGGETLLLFGDPDFMPLMGEVQVVVWSTSGISSSLMVSNCLSNFGIDWKKLGLLSPWLADALPPDEDPMERNDDLGGLFLDENGNCICGLEEKCVQEVRCGKFSLLCLEKVFGSRWYLFNRSGVVGSAESGMCSISFWTTTSFWELLSTTVLSTRSVSSSSKSASEPIKQSEKSDKV